MSAEIDELKKKIDRLIILIKKADIMFKYCKELEGIPEEWPEWHSECEKEEISFE